MQLEADWADGAGVMRGSLLKRLSPSHLDACLHRYTFLLDLALQDGQPLLMVGPTGTGKTTYMSRQLLQGLPQDK